MNARDQVIHGGIQVTKISTSSVSLSMKDSGVSVDYDSVNDAWLLSLPTELGGNVEGLCGKKTYY